MVTKKMVIKRIQRVAKREDNDFTVYVSEDSIAVVQKGINIKEAHKWPLMKLEGETRDYLVGLLDKEDHPYDGKPREKIYFVWRDNKLKDTLDSYGAKMGEKITDKKQRIDEYYSVQDDIDRMVDELASGD